VWQKFKIISITYRRYKMKEEDMIIASLKAIGLLHVMVITGEKHTDESVSVIKESIFILKERLREIGGL